MEFEKTYCYSVKDKDSSNLHRIYHDLHYGFPIEDDNELFCRLVLEINQAGLSWDTILKKEKNFREAFDNFDIEVVANYKDSDRERLLSNAGIIRNKLKVNAAIYNAQQILQLQEKYGSFKKWLDSNYPKPIDDWVKLFKKHFKFTGGEITKEFLMSSGYLEGAHHPDCPIYDKLIKLKRSKK